MPNKLLKILQQIFPLNKWNGASVALPEKNFARGLKVFCSKCDSFCSNLEEGYVISSFFSLIDLFSCAECMTTLSKLLWSKTINFLAKSPEIVAELFFLSKKICSSRFSKANGKQYRPFYLNVFACKENFSSRKEIFFFARNPRTIEKVNFFQRNTQNFLLH